MSGSDPTDDVERLDILCVAVDGPGDVVGRLERRPNGLAVSRGTDADDAVATVRRDAVDCVVVGHAPPDVDARSVFERVREKAPNLPVVFYRVPTGTVGDLLDADATEVVRDGPADGEAAVLENRIRTIVERTDRAQGDWPADSRLHSLLEHSSDRLGVLDADGTYKYVSPAVEHLMGYDPAELVGTSGFEYVHPGDRAHVRSVFERIVENPDETHTVEYRLRDADGTWRWVESRGTNYLDDPAIEGIVVNSREVTERKERERELRAEQAFTESIVAALPDVFYVFDEGGNFLRWNDRLNEVTGYTDEEITEMHPTEFVAPEDRATVAEVIGEVIEQDTTVTVEASFETKDGDHIPYEFTGAKVTDDGGETLGLAGIGRDVSERKERQRRFEAVFDNTYQFTGLMDPDGTLLEANETALAFGGLDRSDIVGSKLWETYWFQNSEAARESARAAVEQAREGRLYREELTVQGADDTDVIDFSVRPIVDDDGEVTLLIPEGRLITELKERERHLRVLHRFLRHNLRNKMTVIEGNADRLADRLSDPSDIEYASQISGAATDLIELSETAHTLSQVVVEADDEQHPVSVDRTLAGVKASIAKSYPEATVTVQSDADHRVRADWRLEVVFEQLVENAVEHADHDCPVVDVTVKAADGRVAVHVADNGPGIPADELRGVVTDERQTQLTHGTGFGLWLIRSVVDDFGGDLAYESPADGGSILTVTLREAGADQSATESPSDVGES